MKSLIPESFIGSRGGSTGDSRSTATTDPNEKKPTVQRRRFLAMSGVTAAIITPGWASADQNTDSSPRATAEAYIEALDAGDRDAANDLIATEGPLDPWSTTEFGWVGAFDFEFIETETPERSLRDTKGQIALSARGFEIRFVAFEPIKESGDTAIGDITISIAGNTDTVRYQFRKIEDEWLIWAAIDGLRSDTAANMTPESTARTYVKALDAGDRDAVNDLIAVEGTLDTWSSSEFDWVVAFDFEFVGFEAYDENEDKVLGDVTMTIDGNTGTVEYEFRRIEGEWLVWESDGSLR